MTEIVKTHIHVRDQLGNPVSCRVNIPGAIHPDTRSTGSDGTAIFQLEEGEFYVASVLPLSGYTLLPEGSNASFPAANFTITLNVTKETTPSLKNIPPEIVDIMPAGTTRIVAIPLKPLSWANFTGLRSHLSPIVDIIARTITVGGYIGWRSLGVYVVKLSTGEIQLVIFLGGV